MKSILISIRPPWCELIASGKKTVEVRKTRPKLETPFKVYIYCSKAKTHDPHEILEIHSGGKIHKANGKVIGEFVCDYILDFTLDPYGHHSYFISDDDFESTCFTLFDELWDYGKGKTLYGWHISDLVIYDKPKKLSEFVTEGDCTCENCHRCRYFERGNGYNVEADCLLPYGYNFKTVKPIFRAPQSWCYVEEV